MRGERSSHLIGIHVSMSVRPSCCSPQSDRPAAESVEAKTFFCSTGRHCSFPPPSEFLAEAWRWIVVAPRRRSAIRAAPNYVRLLTELPIRFGYPA